MTTLTDKLFGRERRELKIVFALVVLTLSAVLLYPLGCVLFQSILDGNGSLTLANYTSLLSEPRFWNALSNSFAVSGLSAVIAAVLAFGGPTVCISRDSTLGPRRSFRSSFFYRFFCLRSPTALR